MFRKAIEEDIPLVLEIIRQAQNYLKEMGIDQWQNGYPNEESIRKDLLAGYSYVLQSKQEIQATFMFSLDGEPSYNQIDGQWLTEKNSRYGVIHRLAVREDLKGSNLGREVLEWVKEQCLDMQIMSLRLDTHKDNHSMQRLVGKWGMVYCGEIILSDGSSRKAYERILQRSSLDTL